MNDETTILAHWPFVRAHLDFDRRPAARRLLDFVAEQQAKTLEPTPISAAWLRQWGMTGGETGRARTVAKELASAGVLHRWTGAGQRPDVWAISGRLERWQVPWRSSARGVALVIGACVCRARFAGAARFPAQEGSVAARQGPKWGNFALPPTAHQDIREPWRAANDTARAALAHVTPSDLDLQNPAARVTTHETPPFSVSYSWTSTSYDDDAGEAAYRALAAAIADATGEAVFGRPRDALRRIAADAGADAGALAAYLGEQTWARSPVVLVEKADQWLADQRRRREQAAGRRERAAMQRRALLERMLAAGEELPPEWETELEELQTVTAMG